ncbi:MAG: transposase [Synergistaceae bacterium]|nr:transposase [Synergistaceae bacterium]
MNSRERIAYLRGLLDFMPKEEKETKIYSAIVEALDSLASDMEEHAKLLDLQREDYDSLADEVSDLQESVYDLEESLGAESDEDYGGEVEDESDEDGESTESYISMTCPSCAYSFYYKYEEGKENEKLVCPSCGEEFSRSL